MALSGNMQWKSFGSPSNEQSELSTTAVETVHKISASVALALATTDGKSV